MPVRAIRYIVLLLFLISIDFGTPESEMTGAHLHLYIPLSAPGSGRSKKSLPN
jgi:hypothetical protein